MKLGIDIGFGHVKYAFFEDQELKLSKFPSVVAQAGDDVEKSENANVSAFEGNLYYVGDLALKQHKNNIKEIITYSDLEKFAPLFLAQILKNENFDINEIDEIICGLAPVHKNQISNFKKRLENFKIANMDFKFNVKITPQGVGAVKALKYFFKQQNKPEDNDYIVIDIGFNTMEVIFCYDKEIQLDKINEKNSFENRGVILIARSMQNYIKNNFNRDITLKESLAIILNKSYKLRGEIHNLEEIINEFRNNYTKELMMFLELNYSNELDKLDLIAFVGGGGYFINEAYATNVKTFKHSEYFNAIGNLVQ